MWIAFNKTTNAVLAQLNYGSPARQGITNNFSIFAYFDELELDDTAFVATISFKRPDGTNVPTTYFMDQVGNENVFHADQASPIGSSPIFFVDGISYPGFVFTPQDPAILSMAGRYEATIKIYYNEQEVTNGTVRFFVENAVYNDTYDISASQWSELLRKFPALSGSGSLLLVSSDDPDSLRGLGLVSGVPVYYTVDNTVRLVAESDGVLNIDTIVMYSKAMIDTNFVKKTGALPFYIVSLSDLVMDFITENNLDSKPFIFKTGGEGNMSLYIGVFGLIDANRFNFSIINVSGERYGTYVSSSGSSKTFSNLINQYHLPSFETKDNKTIHLTASSTDDQYPTAKAVFDKTQEILEVAEGRTRSFVVEPDMTISYLRSHVSVDKFILIVESDGEAEEKDATEYYENGDYDNYDLLNSYFNTYDFDLDFDSATYQNKYILARSGPGNAAYYYLIPQDFIADYLNRGDIFYVSTDGTPDRWYVGSMNFYAWNIDTAKKYIHKIFAQVIGTSYAAFIALELISTVSTAYSDFISFIIDPRAIGLIGAVPCTGGLRDQNTNAFTPAWYIENGLQSDIQYHRIYDAAGNYLEVNNQTVVASFKDTVTRIV